MFFIVLPNEKAEETPASADDRRVTIEGVMKPNSKSNVYIFLFFPVNIFAYHDVPSSNPGRNYINVLKFIEL